AGKGDADSHELEVVAFVMRRLAERVRDDDLGTLPGHRISDKTMAIGLGLKDALYLRVLHDEAAIRARAQEVAAARAKSREQDRDGPEHSAHSNLLDAA